MPSLNKSNKILIVGAGFAGATIARILAENGYKIDLIDRRNHIAGNAYDYEHESGITVHKYGPHIFHTSNEKVINFLSKFTEWTPYEHKVKAKLSDGNLVTLPPNKETLKILGKENIIDVLFRPYTKKMWGLDIEELDSSIIKRIPIRDDLNELYFPSDSFQNMPKKGYTHLFNKMLDHEEISISLETSFTKSMESNYEKVFNSMPIDEYYNYEYGELPYRSIKFHNQLVKNKKVYPVSQINFTDDDIYTRVVEWKNFPNHGKNDDETLLTFEEPCSYKENNMERYYPVKDIQGDNRKLYEKYTKIDNKKNIFIGRCGLYVYVDMHQAISSSMAKANKFIKENKVKL